MKIAYLILAHHQPVHLKRLIEALRYDGDYCFVHLDLKADISEFKNNTGGNVFFLDERIEVNHAGFSQVRAMISLMKKAFEKQDFDYFIFLSGVDYPLKSPDKIHSFLGRNYSMNFMKFFLYSPQVADNYHLSRYHNVDYVCSAPKVGALMLRVTFKLARKILPKRSFFKDMIPYRGSTSWCLHKDSIEYVLKFLDSSKGKRLLNFFKYSFSPDELLFQTIILNSPFAKKCYCYDEYRESVKNMSSIENKAYLHYIDWDSKRENPAILDESDFEKLIKSDYFFARKFDEKKSSKLLKKIDENLLRGDKTKSIY